MPSAFNALAGLRPTVGLVSRSVQILELFEMTGGNAIGYLIAVRADEEYSSRYYEIIT
jgi:hypothetical protein